MEEHEIYKKWIRWRQEVHIPAHFTGRVMDEINLYEEDKEAYFCFRTPLAPDSFASRALRVALALGMSALGLFRLSHVALNLLYP